MKGKEKANRTHLEIGKIVRKAIAEAGGTMPGLAYTREEYPGATTRRAETHRTETASVTVCHSGW